MCFLHKLHLIYLPEIPSARPIRRQILTIHSQELYSLFAVSNLFHIRMKLICRGIYSILKKQRCVMKGWFDVLSNYRWQMSICSDAVQLLQLMRTNRAELASSQAAVVKNDGLACGWLISHTCTITTRIWTTLCVKTGYNNVSHCQLFLAHCSNVILQLNTSLITFDKNCSCSENSEVTE